MREIDFTHYGPVAKELVEKAVAEKLPRTLPFSSPVAEVHSALAGMTDQTISQNRRVRMPHDAEALRAALWLLYDFKDESHDISQKLATPSGSYWHAILHRREPDPSNSKYWFHRVGEHPVFSELLQDAQEIAQAHARTTAVLSARIAAQKSWDASFFVDQCTGAPDSLTAAVLLEIQRREWLLLFDYNFQKAFA